jgi:dTDP-4-amino-4,6-dideoxygalactose transaminase
MLSSQRPPAACATAGRDGSAGHLTAGYNERLDALQAAVLRVKLPRLDGWNTARRAAAARYRCLLAGAVELLEVHEQSDCVYHLFPIKVRERDALARRLAERGIETGVHYPVAVVDQPPLQAGAVDAPVARDWAARELSLPIFAELTGTEVEIVASAVAASLTSGGVRFDRRHRTSHDGEPVDELRGELRVTGSPVRRAWLRR